MAADLSRRLPPMMMARAVRMIAQSPPLNDDTEPSPSPTKKKYSTMA